MTQPSPASAESYYKFPFSQPAPAPSQTLTPNTQTSTPSTSAFKPDVSSDGYCLYTTQGKIVCNKKADNIAIAPWGIEK